MNSATFSISGRMSALRRLEPVHAMSHSGLPAALTGVDVGCPESAAWKIARESMGPLADPHETAGA